MMWTNKSWNTCTRRSCRGPVEGPGGSVEFFDGSEAYCIECGAAYVVSVNGDLVWLTAEGRRPRRSTQ